MVFRKAPWKFGYRSVKYRTSRWLEYVNERPTTENDQIYPQIPFLIRAIKYKMKHNAENTPGGQLKHMTFALTNLFRDERVLLSYNKASELRPYAERLIIEAMRNGDRHKPTMELANFWLKENNLIHKLFKVFVPRYSEYNTAFTALHMLGKDYDAYSRTFVKGAPYFQRRGEAVLEMRGNSLPPIIRRTVNKSGSLTNLLIEGARRHHESQQQPHLHGSSPVC